MTTSWFRVHCRYRRTSFAITRTYLRRVRRRNGDTVVPRGLPRAHDGVCRTGQQVDVSWRDLQQHVTQHGATEQGLPVRDEAREINFLHFFACSVQSGRSERACKPTRGRPVRRTQGTPHGAPHPPIIVPSMAKMRVSVMYDCTKNLSNGLAKLDRSDHTPRIPGSSIIACSGHPSSHAA